MSQQKKRRVGIQDVAKRAGVSATTVSFVINKTPNKTISEATRDRVMSAVRELGYVRHTAGRRLASGRSNVLGLVLGDEEHLRVDGVIPHMLYGMNETCKRNGFQLLIRAAGGGHSRHSAYSELVMTNEIDGLLVLHTLPDDPDLKRLLDDGFPVVADAHHDHPKSAFVSVDNVAATQLATQHLIGLGHRRIGFLSYTSLERSTAMRRFRGFRDALSAAGLELQDEHVAEAALSPESGYRAMKRLIASDPMPTAVVLGNDSVGLGAIAALHDAGIAIPDDVALVSFDDLPIARYCVPPLTTVRFPAIEFGAKSAELLVRLVRGEPVERRHVYLETELIVRSSCGAR